MKRIVPLLLVIGLALVGLSLLPKAQQEAQANRQPEICVFMADPCATGAGTFDQCLEENPGECSQCLIEATDMCDFLETYCQNWTEEMRQTCYGCAADQWHPLCQ